MGLRHRAGAATADGERGGRPGRGDARWTRRADYARRWTVERTFAWLGNYRRLLIRWERLLPVYQGLMTFVATPLGVNHLVRGADG